MLRPMSSKPTSPFKIIAQNRKAHFNYSIKEKLEAGIVLTGSELKSLRQGKSSIEEAFAGGEGNELYLFNATINEYGHARAFSHEPRRPRKLLLKRREINKLLGAIKLKGITLIPLSFYFNHKGTVKVSLGLGEGKKLHDKRQHEKEKDWNRQKQRILKNKNAED